MWAAVYGVAQSQTRLKRLSSSSSPLPRGPQQGQSEGAEDREALTEREDTAKGSGKIWRLKPRQQGWTPGGTPGRLCTGNLGLQSAGRKQQGGWGSALLCAGQRLAEACPGGDGLVGRTLHRNPSGLLGGKGQGLKAVTGTQGEEPPTSPPITAHYCPWTTPQLRPCTQTTATVLMRGFQLQ